MCGGGGYNCIGILAATTGLFCLTTILLAIAVIILLLKNCRGRGDSANGAHRASVSTGVKRRGNANPSYWINYDLDSPKISVSTPNLSEWASSPPPNTFFSSPPPLLDRENHARHHTTYGSRGMVASTSMAPVTPRLSEHTERRLRKSMSNCDLKAYKETLDTSKKRREPPLPPTLERPSSMWPSSGRAAIIPKTSRPLSPPLLSKPVPVPRKKKRISALLEEKQESQLNEYDSMELESQNFIPTPRSLSGFSLASDSSDSCASGSMIGTAMVNAVLSGSAVATPSIEPTPASTPLYEVINKSSLNEPSEYETIREFLKR